MARRSLHRYAYAYAAQPADVPHGDVRRQLAVLVVFALGAPFALLFLPGPEWLNRFFALAWSALVVPVALTVYATRGAVLSASTALLPRRSDRLRPWIEVAIRTGIVTLAAALVWFGTVPFVEDAAPLINAGRPVMLDADLRAAPRSARAPYFMRRAYAVRPDGASAWTRYELFFSFARVRPGRYAVTVMPHLHAILALAPR